MHRHGVDVDAAHLPLEDGKRFSVAEALLSCRLNGAPNVMAATKKEPDPQAGSRTLLDSGSATADSTMAAANQGACNTRQGFAVRMTG